MSNEQVNDIIQMFELDSETDSDTNDYNSTKEDEDISGDKRSFNDLANDVGDEIQEVGKDSPELASSGELHAGEPVVKEDQTDQSQDQSDQLEETSKDKSDEESESAEKIIKESVMQTGESDTDDLDLDSVFDRAPSNKKDNQGDNRKSDDSVSESSSYSEEQTKESSETVRQEESPVEHGAASDEAPEKAVPFDTSIDKGSTDSSNETDDSEVKVKQGVKIKNGQIQWMLDPHSEKYEPFYDSKQETLDLILPGGQVPFEQYKKELKEARVDLNVSSNDFDELYERMSQIQNWKERVTEIAIHVNEQYYMWDRFVELLRGVLARTEYEKPALKQDGVVFQHMRDMELYHSELKMLHNTVNSVLKNLDSAWDTLNRTVTIALKEQERDTAERYNKNMPKGNQQNNQSSNQPNKSTESQQDPKHQSSTAMPDDMLDDFDGLEGEATVEVSRAKKGSQRIGWDEV